MGPLRSSGTVEDPLGLRNRKLLAAKVLVDLLRRFPATRRIAPAALPIGDIARLLHGAVGGAQLERPPLRSGDSEGVGVYVALDSGVYRYDRYTRLLYMMSSEDIRPQLSLLDRLPPAPLNLLYVGRTGCAERRREEDNAVLSALNTAALCEEVAQFCAAEGLSTSARGWLERNLLAATVGMPQDEYLLLVQSVGYPGHGAA
ncbi:nitroreductase family protein [Massilia aerilata]|uniref:Nitroreductase family protein n=1 Tax=Massilia aerilata TaxID=453817 RepID=A0ABW0RWI0_9BURK